MAESGHVVNVANLKKARDMATGWGGKYQPSNSQLDVGKMSVLVTDAETQLDSVQTEKTP